MKENDIVISGIAGRFPLCENSEEFWRRLISGEDLSSTTNDERWPLGFLGLPARTRRVKNIEKFDAEFFKKTKVESDSVDPQYRILLEVAYEAIYDSGIT
ncbi:acyl transferase domain protein-like protein [Dinothrombium tinctorium]|uniref:Acyl transferase domain protein-like protein n=1 Tax=Dinothrombium tinctorium TaxID=1965070 RepID=A0A3S3RSD1_9ACAR|nr:acyl transferase domain protein-like protein [Dinothrombium tinctorium]